MKKFNLIFVILIGILLVSGVYALTSTASSSIVNNPTTTSGFSNPAASTMFTNPTLGLSSVQSSQPNFNTYYTSEQISTYWPILSKMNGQCTASQDFLIQISPAGCTPTVVRSDLLEEQNVAVFCQLDALRINPLIKVSSIKSISFKGQYPEGVVGISFHPARAAIRSYRTLLGSPLLNNIGYVVIVLKQNPKEKTMPKFISGNLTATISYDAESAFGVGRSEYYLPVMSDENWSLQYADSSFWLGKGFLRASDIQDNKAKILLYTDKDTLFNQVVLQEGQESSIMYFPGFYCQAGLKVKLNKITAPEKQAKLNIDGQDLWVRKGSKLINNNCEVRDLNVFSDQSGSISIYCPGQKINLLLQKSGIKMLVDNQEKSVGIGGKIADVVLTGQKTTKPLYLVYTGEFSDKIDGEGKSQKIALVTDFQPTGQQIADITNKFEELKKTKIDIKWEIFEQELRKSLSLGTGRQVYIIIQNKINSWEFTPDVQYATSSSDKEDKSYGASTNYGEPGNLLEYYFGLENDTVNTLLNEYPSEKGDLEVFGEEALWQEIQLAGQIGKQETQRVLLQRFVNLYPSSDFAVKAREMLFSVSSFDYSKAYSSVLINNNYYTIGVNQFKDINPSDKSVKLRIDNFEQTIHEGENISIPGTSDKLYVKKIEPLTVTLTYNKATTSVASSSRYSSETTRPLSEGAEYNFSNGKIVNVVLINSEKVAYVSLEPVLQNTGTSTNFSFHIGIEKRAIQLSTEKTQEMIDNLNKTIAQWEDVTNKLGNIISGWKGACFATSAVLMLKNLASGFSGEATARQKVMETYKAKCATLIKEGKYQSNTECYNALSSNINTDVTAMTNAIKNTNDKITSIQNKFPSSSGDLLTGPSIDTQKAIDAYKADLIARNGQYATITAEGKEQKIDINNINSFDQLRAIDTLTFLKQKGASADAISGAQKELDSQLTSIYREQQLKELQTAAQEKLKSRLGSQTAPLVKSVDSGTIFTTSWDGQTAVSYPSLKAINTDIKDNTKIQFITDSTGDYILVLKDSLTGTVGVDKVYRIGDGGTYTQMLADPKDKNNKFNEFQKYTFVQSSQCNNKFAANEAQVRYYETEPNKGLPAIVPFDLKKGWYVKVPQSLGGITSTQQKTYQASGAVQFFYICNVGSNGRVDNMQPDDICQSFNINTYDKVTSFGGCTLTQSEVKKLVENAQEAIRQAASQYGKRSITVLGQQMGAGVPMQDSLVECQDFMSPEDCKILFNVCDPVICPSSRCNLGGKYPVADVVQTGIIGSLLLCLPNAKQGILVPVCLTGVHAGLQTFVSILKSERDCLQTSLETGEHVGICDEITSIYLCEFFWRQLAPLVNILIPKIIESAYGQGVNGGGEYLTVMNSWDNMQKSIDYFKNNYAQNSFNAFKIRSVEDAGTEFCRAFLGTSIPTDIDSLLAPESPSQFYAWFSETSLTEATVPATSQYKVYYHIFAGNDKGIQFAVYLKNPPASSYYATNSQVAVKTGFIARGESADEAIDFSAPAGYKELCVVIDAQTECGFKSVSTDFSLDYLKSKAVEQQALTKNIATEKECISGTPSLYSLANPNLQAGVEQVINPSIDTQGIVRVCSSYNPGINVNTGTSNYVTNTVPASTTAASTVQTATGVATTAATATTTSALSQRWVDVGYCGDAAIRCWLDVNSVAEDLKKVQAVDKTLTGQSADLSMLYGDNYTLPAETTEAELAVAREDIRKLDEKLSKSILDGQKDYSNTRLGEYIGETISNLTLRLDNVYNKGFMNSNKAEALKLKADVYRIVVSALFRMDIQAVVPAAIPADTSTTVEQTNGGEYSSDYLYNTDELTNEEVAAAEQSAAQTGFSLVIGDHPDGDIYQNGAKTGLYLVALDNENGWTIMNDIGFRPDADVGKIIKSSGAITFDPTSRADDSSVDGIANDLQGKYVFDGTNFILGFQLPVATTGTSTSTETTTNTATSATADNAIYVTNTKSNGATSELKFDQGKWYYKQNGVWDLAEKAAGNWKGLSYEIGITNLADYPGVIIIKIGNELQTFSVTEQNRQEIITEIIAFTNNPSASINPNEIQQPDAITPAGGVEDPNYKDVNQVRLIYTEGFDDSFYFRWNANQKKPEVLMWLNNRGIGSGTKYMWTSNIWGNERFASGADVYEYEKTDIDIVMNKQTWTEAIDAIKSINSYRSKNTNIYIYQGEEKGWVE